MDRQALNKFRNGVSRYLAAVLATALALLLSSALNGPLDGTSPMLLFAAAVLGAAWYGGLVPGLLATGLSAVAESYLFLEPIGSFRVTATSGQVQLALFIAVGMLISIVCDRDRWHNRHLEDAREFASEIVETVGESLIVLDSKLRVLLANRSFYKTFHVTPDETKDRLLYELGNGQWNIPELRTLLEEILPQHTEVSDYEVTHTFPDIGLRIMRLNARRLHREGIGTAQFLLAIQDVTERTHLEDGKNISEVRYRRLFEAAQDGILILDGATAKITDANQFIGDLLGFTPAELIGKELWEIGLFNDIGASKAAMLALQQDHYIRYEDLPLETRDGRRADVEFVSNVYMEGARKVIQCNIRDITARKHLLELQRATEDRLGLVMDSMPQKTFTASANGEFDYFNPQWLEYTGLAYEQIKGWGWMQFVHPEDVQENVRAWQYSIDNGLPFHFEHRFRRADGEFRWHLSRAVPLRDADGAVVIWVGSNTDIHEQRQTANRLREYAAELSESDRRKNEFLAVLAHELRNPLAPMSNALQIMRLRGGDPLMVQSASEMMERQVGQMVRLVDDLLDVSRITRGKIELRRGRVDLVGAVNQALEAARPQCVGLGHELIVTFPSEPIFVDVDAARLSQVVGNLLNNACKFTDRGGRIWLSIELEGSSVLIRVRDSGIGIAPDALPHIFDMFLQVDTSLERSAGGLGIGLTLARNLAEMHGGTLEGSSRGLGEGSEFVVRLPLAIDMPVPVTASESALRRTGKSRRILVVDDNVDSATSLTAILNLRGNETCIAHDGLEALEAAASFRPNVILLDIGLPKLNGYEVAREIRLRPWGSGILLVAMTGWGQEGDRKRSAAAGFDQHLVKPVDMLVLMKLLDEFEPSAVA